MAADPDELLRLSDRLTSKFRDTLSLRADNLPTALHRAGRRLPASVRRDGATFVAACQRSQNPRLARVTDGEGARQAAQRIDAYLSGLNPEARRARFRANLFADVAFRLAVVIALFIGVLVWRGYV